MGRDFRFLLAGTACNSFGFFGEQVVVGFIVYEITGASVWVGVSLALYFAPMFFFGLASGVIADWKDRRVLLARIELGIAALLLAFAALSLWSEIALPSVLSLSVLTGSARALHQSVRGAYAYDLVGGAHIVQGLGRLNLGARIGQLAGAAATGYCVHRAGVTAAFGLLGAVHVVGAAAYFQLGRAAGTDRVRKTLAESVTEFARELRTNRLLATLVAVTAGIEVLGFSFVTALPEMAKARFGVGPDGLGTLHAARAVGGIAAALALATVLRIEKRGVGYIWVIGLFGVAIFALALASDLVVAMIVLAIIAGLAVASDVLSQSMMQLSVPDALRGRAMGAWVFAIGAAPIGHLQLGFVSGLTSLPTALMLNGAGLVLLGLAALALVPRLRAS